MLVLLLLGLFSSLAKEGAGVFSLNHQRIENQHSLYSPMDTLQHWTIGGATVSATKFVRLTPASHSRSGWLINNEAIRSENWEMEVSMSIRSAGSFGGDGFGIWVLNRSMLEKNGNESVRFEGNVLGMRDNFDGFGVIVDTYDNNGDGRNPIVMVLWNDGSEIEWDHDEDFEHDSFNNTFDKLHIRCTLILHQKVQFLKIMLRYQRGVLHVYTSESENSEWQFCLAAQLNNKTKDTHSFAFTALTGAVADIHDLQTIIVQYLDEDSPEVDDWTLARQGALKKSTWKSLFHWIACTICGCYL